MLLPIVSCRFVAVRESDLPRHYRDSRTEGMMEHAFQRMPKEEIYRRTGIQFMPLNTIYQLLAEVESGDGLLDRAERLLFMPDYLRSRLTGEAGGSLGWAPST